MAFFAQGVIPPRQSRPGERNDNVGVAGLAPAQPTQLPRFLTPLEINATLSANKKKKKRGENLEKELEINCLPRSNNRADLNQGVHSLEFLGCNEDNADVLFRVFQASCIQNAR